MALPLYLAMTASEIASSNTLPANFAYMACHYSAFSQGLSNIPSALPENSVLILNDNFPCQDHSPSLVADQLKELVDTFHCESLLLDFQRPPEPESKAMAEKILRVLPCPTALTPEYGKDLDCALFLPPCPLHVPLEDYLEPWKGREIWLEAALCQEDVLVTKEGSRFVPYFPTGHLTGGFFDKDLCCNYNIDTAPEQITFTLFDTPENMEQKLALAESLGVVRAVGLWQELGTFQTRK